MAEVEAAVWESRADGQVVGLTVRMGNHFHVHTAHAPMQRIERFELALALVHPPEASTVDTKPVVWAPVERPAS